MKDYKIYLYSFENKPTDAGATLWEYSRIYNIEFHESLNEHNFIGCFINQKLFLFNEGHLAQWDLSTMTFEKQYNLVDDVNLYSNNSIVINTNQTLLALNVNNKTDIYSMETGTWISRYC